MQKFPEILGDQNVLENHYNVDYDSSEEFKPMQLAAENWDKPVVVTTNVQFLNLCMLINHQNAENSTIWPTV